MTTPIEEITPDQLLEPFRGSSMKSIILFTIVVHIVVIVGTSIPYFLKSSKDQASSELGEKERMEQAADEATKALREIATKHGLKAQDLSTRISGGAAPVPVAPAVTAPAPVAVSPTPVNTTTSAPAPAVPEPPKPAVVAPAPIVAPSAIEAKLQEAKPGPKLPPVEDPEEDLFK
jgi:hypothetical protein